MSEGGRTSQIDPVRAGDGDVVVGVVELVVVVGDVVEVLVVVVVVVVVVDVVVGIMVGVLGSGCGSVVVTEVVATVAGAIGAEAVTTGDESTVAVEHPASARAVAASPPIRTPIRTV